MDLCRVRSGKYQLYQPGYRKETPCWLAGGWVTVSKEEWEAKYAAHIALYQDISVKHELRFPKPDGSLTPAQQQAWEYSSGGVLLFVVDSKGHHSHIQLPTAGSLLTTSALRQLKSRKLKVYPWVLDPKTGIVTEVAKFVTIPAMCVVDTTTAVNPERVLERQWFDGVEDRLDWVQTNQYGNFMNVLVELERKILVLDYKVPKFRVYLTREELVEKHDQILRKTLKWFETWNFRDSGIIPNTFSKAYAHCILMDYGMGGYPHPYFFEGGVYSFVFPFIGDFR